ncbi:MAG: PKD domain-containing protein [Desulfobacteraceae bacterium]|jgi:hypothetical protein
MDCTFVCCNLLPLPFPKSSFKKASKCPKRLAGNKGVYASLIRFIGQAALAALSVILLHSLSLAAEVILAWDVSNPTPDGYRVFARVEGQDYDYSSPVWPGAGDDPTQTACVLKGLADGTSYYFVVRAYVGSDESGDSNEANHITMAAQTTAYTITANAGANGSISPASATVNAGESQTFTITPDTGYHVDDVLVDGVSLGAVTTYTFSAVDADHTITVGFAADAYTIQASAGSGGAISPSGAVSTSYGGNQTFTITPDIGYHVGDVLVDGVSVGAVTTYTFSAVDADHTIAASFAADAYTIQASAGSGGTLSPSGAVSVSPGGNQTFTITPDIGYHVGDVLVDGISVGAVTTYTFSALDADHSITASFAVDAYTIEASAGSGGFITPSGSIAVSAGSSHSFTIGADDSYEIDDVMVDGNSVGALESYNFQQVNADHTIEARFRPTNQLPNADAGPDQVVDEQSVVTLNGANSGDSDDGIAAFKWRQVKGTSVALSACCEEIVTFTAPDVDTNGEALAFELTVTDYSDTKTRDRCIVNVTWVNQPPNADAGDDQSVREGTAVTLSAADSVDPDDGIAAYQWDQIQGPEVTLSNSKSSAPEFTAPDVGPDSATLKFQLTVTDAGGLQDTDNCTVNVTWENVAPVADAGLDQQVAAGDEVVLDGSKSSDSDGLNLNYQWRQTFGPPVTLSDATAVRPLFTVPLEGFDDAELTFELTVTDNGGLQGMDTCKVNVLPTDNEQMCVTADNRAHMDAGRAFACGGFHWYGGQACAVGSGDRLGYAMWWYSQTTSLEETSAGYWERVPGCP